jgi:hypothetical protein
MRRQSGGGAGNQEELLARHHGGRENTDDAGWASGSEYQTDRVCWSLEEQWAMKLKSAILSVLGRDSLKRIAVRMEFTDVDLRSVQSMRTALSRSRRVAAEDLLQYMRKDEITAVCELVGVSGDGRRDELIERLGSGLERAAQLAQTTGLEDGTHIKPLKKGWVVVSRDGFFLADPDDAAWVGQARNREMPPALFPTPEAALRAWEHSRKVAQARRREGACDTRVA